MAGRNIVAVYLERRINLLHLLQVFIFLDGRLEGDPGDASIFNCLLLCTTSMKDS